MAGRALRTASKVNARSVTISRSLLLGGILVFWILALVTRLAHLQILQYPELLARAQRQQQYTIELTPKRGTVFDREMRPLAMSLAAESVYAVPGEIPNPAMVANLLGSVLDLESNNLQARFKAFRSFCWVKRKVSTEETNRVRALNLKGIYFQKEMKRSYPKDELAAHVLGYVGLDDVGLGALEYGMDKAIQGRAVRVLVAADARRQSFSSSAWEGQPGKNVVLTIDENIQYIAEKALAGAVRRWRAASGVVIVQEPHTGEILAMASEPTFNPNAYAKSKPEALANRAIAWVYEPGSTFKLVTLAAALEEKLTHPREMIDCQQGSIVLAGHVIRDHKPFGTLTVEQVLAQSSDVGTIKLGLRLGAERLHKYIRSFGFGARTEIELPGEERGLLKPPNRWSGISIGEISMGQEVAVTPLQLATACSAIANGGILFRPRIVRDVFRGEAHDPLPPARGRRVISERTAQRMKEMLTTAVERGSGTQARLDGYSAGGKTGTAQKIDSTGTYSKTHYVSSFVGFCPVERPALTILVVIDSPVGAIYGSEVAAPMFRAIAEQTLGYLNVPQDNPSLRPQFVTSVSARFPRQAGGDQAGLLPRIPEPLGVATPSLRHVSYSGPFPRANVGTVVLNEGPLLTVPDFLGQGARQVAEQCQRLALEVNVLGSGLAVEQNPRAGARVPEGTRIWVRFAR